MSPKSASLLAILGLALVPLALAAPAAAAQVCPYSSLPLCCPGACPVFTAGCFVSQWTFSTNVACHAGSVSAAASASYCPASFLPGTACLSKNVLTCDVAFPNTPTPACTTGLLPSPGPL